VDNPSQSSEWPIQMDTCLTPKLERTELSKRSGAYRPRGFDYDQGPRHMEICNFRNQNFGTFDPTTTRPVHRNGSEKMKVRELHRNSVMPRMAGLESKEPN
jgi:hypothetical protein